MGEPSRRLLRAHMGDILESFETESRITTAGRRRLADSQLKASGWKSLDLSAPKRETISCPPASLREVGPPPPPLPPFAPGAPHIAYFAMCGFLRDRDAAGPQTNSVCRALVAVRSDTIPDEEVPTSAAVPHIRRVRECVGHPANPLFHNILRISPLNSEI